MLQILTNQGRASEFLPKAIHSSLTSSPATGASGKDLGKFWGNLTNERGVLDILTNERQVLPELLMVWVRLDVNREEWANPALAGDGGLHEAAVVTSVNVLQR